LSHFRTGEVSGPPYFQPRFLRQRSFIRWFFGLHLYGFFTTFLCTFYADQFQIMPQESGAGGQEGTAMKRIDAVIRQGSLDEVRERLTNIGVEGLTLTEVIGFGRQKGHSEFYRGCEYKVDFHPKLMLTIVAHEDQVEGILDAIVGGARTGRIGDGKIFVTPIDEVVRIRTGEIDKAAL
jgi:nitrogen regulatory protein P-II 1